MKIQKIFHSVSEKEAQRVKVTGLWTWKKVLLAGLTRRKSTGDQGARSLKEGIRSRRKDSIGGKEDTTCISLECLPFTYIALGSMKNTSVMF